jgi:hypothetical protein
VATSCRTRTEDFVFNGAVVVDATDEACLTPCSQAASDAISLANPWIEGGPSGTNLPAGGSVADALACIVPQGISGCGFEEPLESAYKAIARFGTEGESSFGFMREDALLAILFVSDEADCSYNKNFETIFLPDGNRVFWSDPDAGAPTSAVCWNAGVDCAAGTCMSADKDVDGDLVAPQDAADEAVMHPVARFLDQLATVAAGKSVLQPEVVVGLLGGVGTDGNVTYQDSIADPQFQIDYGIGPGCESAIGRAVPPVRLREVAEAQALGPEQTMFSICNGDYGPALQAFVANIASRLP